MNEHLISSTYASVLVDPSPERPQNPAQRSRNSNSADQSWGHITRSLSACSGTEAARNAELLRRDHGSCESGMNATIKILDRLTPDAAILSWRDSTGCCYGYQSWCRGLAKREGRCALSGMPIQPGDQVFRPARQGVRPANAFAMILVVQMETLRLAP